MSHDFETEEFLPGSVPEALGNQVHSADIGPTTEQKEARELLARLDPKQKDMVGLITLGVTIVDIAEILRDDTGNPSKHQVNRQFTNIYNLLGMTGDSKPYKQLRAREIAWRGGLLEETLADDDAETFPFTVTCMARLGLDYADVGIMREYRLTGYQLRHIKRVSTGMTYAAIAHEDSISIRAVVERQQKFINSLGKQQPDGLWKTYDRRQTAAKEKM